MQVLCDLQVLFLIFNCQTPGRNPDCIKKISGKDRIILLLKGAEEKVECKGGKSALFLVYVEDFDMKCYNSFICNGIFRCLPTDISFRAIALIFQ